MDLGEHLRTLAHATDRAIRDMTPSDHRRFWDGLDIRNEQDCWLWQRATTPAGYGIMSVRNTTVRVHRVSCWWNMFPIATTEEIDHLCGNRACANPDHLEAIPHAYNVTRGNAGANWAAKTRCPEGHPYSGENLYVRADGTRQCRACQRERMRQRRARARAAG